MIIVKDTRREQDSFLKYIKVKERSAGITGPSKRQKGLILDMLLSVSAAINSL